MVDLDAVAAVPAVEQQQLRILRHRAPSVDVGFSDLLAAARTFVAELEPLIARDVLAAHQRRATGGGGSQPGLGPAGASDSPADASAATIAARVSSALAEEANNGYDIAS